MALGCRASRDPVILKVMTASPQSAPSHQSIKPGIEAQALRDTHHVICVEFLDLWRWLTSGSIIPHFSDNR
jgi:hypothetical protein